MSLQIELLESSFDQIKPRLDEFGASFYENLFTAYPQAKPLFAKTDLTKQQVKLTQALLENGLELNLGLSGAIRIKNNGNMILENVTFIGNKDRIAGRRDPVVVYTCSIPDCRRPQLWGM